jgi:exodeoxyribonuclease VII small subunit
MALTLDEIKRLDFEEAFKRLSDTTGQLERGNLSLEESLALYEEGVVLAQHCSSLLDRAELRVTQVAPTSLSNPFDMDED